MEAAEAAFSYWRRQTQAKERVFPIGAGCAIIAEKVIILRKVVNKDVNVF